MEKKIKMNNSNNNIYKQCKLEAPLLLEATIIYKDSKPTKSTNKIKNDN